jgi:uncharacterized protein involved in type VI secretion and phage assembly
MMSYSFEDDLINLIHREIARSAMSRPKRMIGLVDGYNSADHTCKVKLLTDLDDQNQPKITGWLPIGTQGASENGVSFVVGPSVGDQVIIDYAEGDAEAGHVSHFLHNTIDQPPNVASGAAVLQHNQSGNRFAINVDGSMMMLHKASTNYVKLDKNGNITANVTAGTQHFIGGDPALGHTMSPVVTSAGPSPFAKARVS